MENPYACAGRPSQYSNAYKCLGSSRRGTEFQFALGSRIQPSTRYIIKQILPCFLETLSSNRIHSFSMAPNVLALVAFLVAVVANHVGAAATPTGCTNIQLVIGMSITSD